MPIEDCALRFSVNPGISYSPLFLGLEACVEAGLDLYQWYIQGYPTQFMELVIAWYQAHQEIRLHSDDAVQRKMERERKKSKKK